MTPSNQLVRLTDANYADGLSALVTGTDPVQISVTLFDQDGDMPNAMGLSDLFVIWGQFIDHDLSLTPDPGPEMVFSPGLVAPLLRSQFDPTTGITGPRQQVNTLTPEIDGSMIYGSDLARETMLRSFEGGALTLVDGFLPPAMEDGSMAGTSPEDPLFLAGDVRANENTGLTTFQTLFAREHNSWAARIAERHPEWSDQQIFDAARSLVEIQLQQITYRDWLPNMVGNAVGTEASFDASISTQISAEFSTAAFRFGHTMVSTEIKRIEENGEASAEGPITLREAFFNNDPMIESGIGDILRGMTGSRAQELDTKVIDDLNKFLVTPEGMTGFSLVALNILRGRDHGLGTYIDVRAALLDDIDPATLDLTDFSIITSDIDAQNALAATFGTVDKVDLWVGGLAEDAIPGALMGATFAHIIAEQFTRTRDGDETFGQAQTGLDADLVAEAAMSTLTDIITRNSDADHMQVDVFHAVNRIGGTEGRDRLTGTDSNDLLIGFGGNDFIRGNDGDDTGYGDAGQDRMFGGTGNDKLDGGTGNDKLYGGSGSDVLVGGGGSDRLVGMADNDLLKGGDGRDILSGGRGDDSLYGGNGHDRLRGNSGDDTLDGGAGRDHLKGGRGDDFIFGGAGSDVLMGGLGDDTFVLKSGGGRDFIVDFRDGDQILLDGYGVSSFAEIEDHITSNSYWTRVDMGDAQLILSGMRFNALDEGDFLFG